MPSDSTMTNKCLFCQNTPLTKEHVLPQWLRQHYPDISAINEFTANPKKRWTTQLFDLTARVVCKQCNEGWMSDLENKFKPLFNEMISLKKYNLDELKQSTIALWVQKTVLMLNQATPGGIKITSETYDEIYQSKKATRRVMVWLGWRMKYGQNTNDPLASFTIKQVDSVQVPSNILDEVKKQISKGGFGWKTTLAIGPLVFELMGHNMNVTMEIRGNTKTMKTIQPFYEDIEWPLEWPIEAEGGLEAVHSR